TTHARGIERLAEARPAAIGYDVLFTEHSRDARQDEPLARAIREAEVALPLLLEAPGRDGRPFDAVLPIQPFRGAAAQIGHVALPHDEDGRARAALVLVHDGQRE